MAAVKWLEDTAELRKEKPSQNPDMHELLVNAKLPGKKDVKLHLGSFRAKAKGCNSHWSSLWAMRNAEIRI